MALWKKGGQEIKSDQQLSFTEGVLNLEIAQVRKPADTSYHAALISMGVTVQRYRRYISLSGLKLPEDTYIFDLWMNIVIRDMFKHVQISLLKSTKYAKVTVQHIQYYATVLASFLASFLSFYDCSFYDSL